MCIRDRYKERIKARVLQAMGRCTRSMEDYSIIVVAGSGLPEYLLDSNKRAYLHPELQAEIEFGIEQSSGVTSGFLKNGRSLPLQLI